ncbi:MAG: aspartate 1-decarboxylase [Bacteroidetes bacterium]|nr:aspartate 1-decarboxylase [Bacteroidota bacterium]
MKRIMFKSKIHRARVTQAELYYEGSITIDSDLMAMADILEYEKVQVVNVNNGHRFETYALKGEPGSGTVCLNGAAARLGHVGDEVIIITYGEYDDDELQNHAPNIILVDEHNSVKNNPGNG